MLWPGLILCLFFIIASVLTQIKSSRWYIRIFDFPRLQVVVIGLIGISLILFSNERNNLIYLLLVLCGAALMFQFWTVLPYTVLSPIEVKNTTVHNPPMSVSLMVCNVFMENKDCPTCKEEAIKADPDIMFFVETDAWWDSFLSEFETTYPYYVKKILDNTYGMILFSRLELVDPEVNFLIKEDIPSIHTKVKLKSGDLIELWLVHPEPPVPGEASDSKQRDAELLLVGRKARVSQLPVLVGGDLNDVAWSHTTRLFKRISKLLDPRVGRGLYSTFHAKYKLLRWPLDHIFISSHFTLTQLKRLPYIGSDHFPIFIKLQLEKNNTNPIKEHADKSDLKEAAEMVNEAL